MRFARPTLPACVRLGPLGLLGWWGLVGLLFAVPTVAEESLGARVFSEKCADCHGEAGQGTDYYGVPLAGDLPVRELARVISETMPEDDAESCVGDEAVAVAKHVYDSFYSPLAQARIRPARRDLQRLTVRQYRQSLADLLGEFRWRREFGDKRGLRARFVRKVNVKAIEDPVRLTLPRFEFVLSELEGIPASFLELEVSKEHVEFGNKSAHVHVNARGGLFAPVTGLYEFFARTPNGVELTVNDEVVIDGRIRSSDDPEVRGRLWLLGGRAYPIHVSTSRTHNDDLRIAVGWRRPGGVDEVIPERFLSPENYPVVHATKVRFPPDDRSVGYVRGASVSAAWDEATTSAAFEAILAVIDDLPEFAKSRDKERHDPDAEVTAEAAADFCRRFAATAFRRPLTDEEAWFFVDRYFERQAAEEAVLATVDATVTDAVERSLLTILKSPRFLYPQAAGRPDAVANSDHYAVASRLALGLWDSLPDDHLKHAARHAQLRDVGRVRRQAERMVGDERTRSKLREFFEHWLRLDHVAKLSRDPKAFPDFNDRVAADMRTSLDLLLDDVVWSGDGDLRRLFLTDELYVNRRLADFLAVEPPESSYAEAFVKAAPDTRERSGVVSHPFMVTALSYHRDTSPIHRGVFLARNVLGRSLRPPPDAVAPLAPELAPDMTTRERVTMQTSPAPVPGVPRADQRPRLHPRTVRRGGPFPGAGRRQAGRSVRRLHRDRRKRNHDPRGPRPRGRTWLSSEDVHRSFVTQLFEHVTKQPMMAFGVETRDRLVVGLPRQRVQHPPTAG